MNAPTGESRPISQAEAIERVEALVDGDRRLESLLYTGGETDYAHIYLASVTGTYNGNQMMWVRYVWLSKPGAFESDMWGENGISMRMVPGMAGNLTPFMARAANGITEGEKWGEEAEPAYFEVDG